MAHAPRHGEARAGVPEEVSARLVSIATPTHPLDGLLYEPPGGATAGVALLMHGNCMNFYVGPSRFLPPVLLAEGFACLAFNRRGHDILVTPHDRAPSGGAFQRVDEAVEDNRLAAEWLAARGFPAPVVIGHSHGGMLAVRHCADHPGTPALVLLSAHRGGRGILPAISANGLFAQGRLEEVAAEAREHVRSGRGDALIQVPGWWYLASAASLLDYLERLPDVLALAPRISCPALFVRGSQEPREIYPAEEFAARSAGTTQVEIVADCDHFYTGREAPVATLVARWLRLTLATA